MHVTCEDGTRIGRSVAGSGTATANIPDTLSRPDLRDCSASDNVTRSLLGYLALAGPFFAVIATGADNAAISLGFTAAVVAGCAWLTAVAVDLCRRTRLEEAASL